MIGSDLGRADLMRSSRVGTGIRARIGLLAVPGRGCFAGARPSSRDVEHPCHGCRGEACSAGARLALVAGRWTLEPCAAPGADEMLRAC